LAGLRLNPEAFSSKYEDEVQFGTDRWEKRVGNPQVTTFLAMATSNASDHTRSAYLNAKWLGMVVSVILSPEGSNSELGGEKVALDGMFVLPEARGTGVGMALVKTAMQWNATNSKGKRRCEIRVGASNETAVKLYQRCGFQPTGNQGCEDLPVEQQTLIMESMVDLG
jgi:GNAT superfamily N-acetyltransferase